ncbi:MAG: glycoside hydrolase family 15 protein [Gemmatimonadetes bacterium]|nr:glycoside hydrolase family 15 protein [Gemmatimonadota bacterium]NIO30535.1 glycoside hydrolase family 15 protein [Gemmatimonadota bacterium]
MAYKPIEDYGVIGDMHSAALVGVDGSIDWFCYPHFDSPSVFAAILDEKKGGHFKICPRNVTHVTTKQYYWPDTNVLVTRFLSPDGVGQIVDYMPVGVPHGERGSHWLVRRVQIVRGAMAFAMECRPAFNYAREEHSLDVTSEGACFRTPGQSLGLVTDIPLQEDGGGVRAEFSLDRGQTAIFVLREIEGGVGCGLGLSPEEEFELFNGTVEWWRHWVNECTYTGRWREAVHRSVLALKLLTYEPTGAIVASPTCSLPETIGGGRNWDYRYAWIRDAAFTLYAFIRVGFTEEAARFGQFLRQRIREPAPDGSLQIMYGVDGRHELIEETLDHLEGYRGSRPVRIGNGAYNQLQLDIYGELMDSIYLYNKYGAPVAHDGWIWLRRMIDWVCDNWQTEDEGIWEVRGQRQHFVYSKLMCWVALDRAIRLADKRSLPADRARWLKIRDQIYEEIFEKGWSDQRQAFVQHYGSDSLDASNLIMPLVFFISPNDPRMLSTIDATLRPPAEGGLLENNLVFRYNVYETEDGLEGEEGSFNMCTFWLVEALARAGRRDPTRLRAARLMFEEMLGYANHLGLYAEETGPQGEALGNFPQAFTHISLISAAYNLDRALGAHD